MTTIPIEPALDEVEAKSAQLVDVLSRLEGRLRTRGQHFWAGWVASSRTRIEADDGWGLKHLRRAFGGAGSLLELDLGKDGCGLVVEAYELADWLGRRPEIEQDSFPWV